MSVRSRCRIPSIADSLLQKSIQFPAEHLGDQAVSGGFSTAGLINLAVFLVTSLLSFAE